MQNTANYKFKKPENTDLYNVQDFSDNMDAIDTALKGLEDGTTPVGNALQLGGKSASEYVQGVSPYFTSGETILAWANNPNGVYKKFVVGDYGIPSDAPKNMEGFATVDIDQSTARRIVKYYSFGTTGYQWTFTRTIYAGAWYSEWEKDSDGGNALQLGGKSASEYALLADLLASGILSPNLAKVSVGNEISLNDLLNKGTVTFFTNWHDSTNFPKIYCDGVMIPSLDGSLKLLLYGDVNRGVTTPSLYIGRAHLESDGWHIDWRNISDGGNADTLDGQHSGEFLTANGNRGVVNPVTDLNDFVTGIGLFGQGVLNIPSDNWWLVISGGNIGTTTQFAINLWNEVPMKVRRCAAGTWEAWSDANVGLANYLPKSGGTVANADIEPLIINRLAGANSFLGFQGNGAQFGGIGFVGVDHLVRRSADGTVMKKILDEGNVGDYALPKSGGTVTGNAIFKGGYDGATHGGSIYLSQPATTDLVGDDIRVHAIGNGITFSELGGNYRGAHLDLSQCGNWESSIILHTGKSAKVAIQSTAPTDTTALWVG